MLPTRIGLFGTGRPITPHDWSAVIGWLLGQPEVVLVHREFPRASRHRVTQGEAARATAQTATVTRPEEAGPVPWIDPRPDIDPQEVIWHIEDVWLRLAVCVPVRIEVVPGYEDQPILRLQGMSTAHFDEELEKAALDPALYRWRVAGRSASFVEAIDVEDDDVLVLLTPMRVVRTWERGPGLVCGMLGVLDNLKEGVVKPDLYEPALNSVYAATLAHYGVVADPARIRDPNRKGSVENAIGHTQDTALKGRRFETIEEHNEFLEHWETKWAGIGNSNGLGLVASWAS